MVTVEFHRRCKRYHGQFQNQRAQILTPWNRIRQHPVGILKRVHNLDRDSRDLGYNQLSDAFALLDFEGFCSVVNQNNFDLAAIIGVYRSGVLRTVIPFFKARSDALELSLWYRHREPTRNHGPFSRAE